MAESENQVLEQPAERTRVGRKRPGKQWNQPDNGPMKKIKSHQYMKEDSYVRGPGRSPVLGVGDEARKR